MKECIITRGSIINNCNTDGKIHLMFTEKERPCKEAYLRNIKDKDGQENSRFFIEIENTIDAVYELGNKYNADILVTENQDFPGIVALVILDEDIIQDEYCNHQKQRGFER